MIIIITPILLTLLSTLVILLMCRETNREIIFNYECKIETESTTIETTELYTWNKHTMSTFLILFVLSGVIGFVISKHVSPVGIVELGACYLATIAAAVIDLKLHIIPNYIPISLIVLRVLIFVYEVFYVDEAIGFLISSLLGCFLCAVMLIIANKLSTGGIGAGDIKLLASIGFMCGLYVVISTMLFALIGCVIASVVIVRLKKGTMKDQLPFGPFILFGMTIVYVFTLY